MKKLRLTGNPYLLFLPFLLLYVIFILIMYQDDLVGDQARYLLYAHNLLHGSYSLPAPDINLVSGPGYPLILAPFMALHLPRIYLILLNAVFHYLSIIFLFKALYQFFCFKKTLIFSLLWACYYVAFQNMPFIATEPFTFFLVALLTYCLVRVFDQNNPKSAKRFVLLSGFVMGYLILTKVMFAYVLLCMIIGSIVLWTKHKKNIYYRKTITLLVIAFVTVLPYLFYTSNITGRVGYLSTGGDNLYWMTTPYEQEYGNWMGTGPLTLDFDPQAYAYVAGAKDTLMAHHKTNFDKILSFKENLEQDDEFKNIAINNIKSHPVKYAQNIFFNIGRFFFNYPFSYSVQRPKTLFVMLINSILFTFILICLIPTIINWRKVSFPIRFMFILMLLYFGGSSLVTGETRIFSIIVPMLIFWIAYILEKTRFNLTFEAMQKDIQQITKKATPVD